MNVWEWFASQWEWLVRQLEITFIEKNRYLLFLEGIKNTLLIAVFALIIGIIIGALVAIVRVYNQQTGKLKILNKFCGAYLALFRGTPIVVQLLIMYYIIFTALDNALIVAILTFGLNSGAYVAEIVRGGIMAVDIGQLEAGRSLGLSYGRTMRLIILPQAIKNILPTLGNEFVMLLKETSVAGYITLRDFARAGANVRADTANPFSLIPMAVVYFLMVMGASKLVKLLERRLRQGDRY